MIAGTGFRLVDIDDVWPRYVDRARRSRTDAATLAWIVARCNARMAVCLECDDGMVVVTAAGHQARVLIAVACGAPGALARRESELVAIARDLGATELSFRTDRCAAWSRVLGPHWTRDGDRFWRST